MFSPLLFIHIFIEDNEGSKHGGILFSGVHCIHCIYFLAFDTLGSLAACLGCISFLFIHPFI